LLMVDAQGASKRLSLRQQMEEEICAATSTVFASGRHQGSGVSRGKVFSPPPNWLAMPAADTLFLTIADSESEWRAGCSRCQGARSRRKKPRPARSFSVCWWICFPQPDPQRNSGHRKPRPTCCSRQKDRAGTGRCASAELRAAPAGQSKTRTAYNAAGPSRRSLEAFGVTRRASTARTAGCLDAAESDESGVPD